MVRLGAVVISMALLGDVIFFPGMISEFGFASSLFSQEKPKQQEQAETKPLLRVFPSFRKEECDWAIRWDICMSCLKIGRRYAQKIHFYPSGPYREHGCYSDEEGFFLMEE
ncbi:hypothetical protein [Leptospira yasudae]|uniref:hypothetical protein n=1 Tax=Leptospira yasudae TaxID=2202201 RepID=UPI001FC9D364|nr:hypothetical protein [Leptospira yasudae]